MGKMVNVKIKYSINIDRNLAETIRNLAHTKKVSAGYVVEAAIKKCIPES